MPLAAYSYFRQHCSTDSSTCSGNQNHCSFSSDGHVRIARIPPHRRNSPLPEWYNHLVLVEKYALFCKYGGLLKNHYGCPVQGVINAVSGKWKVLAIWHLGFGPKRYAQLRKLLPGISEKVLTSQLRQLETDGIVSRKITHSSPPQVTYSLTSAGEELIEPMSVLCGWGTRHLGIQPNLPRYPKVKRLNRQGSPRRPRVPG